MGRGESVGRRTWDVERKMWDVSWCVRALVKGGGECGMWGVEEGDIQYGMFNDEGAEKRRRVNYERL